MMSRTERYYLVIKNKILHRIYRGWNRTKLTFRKFKATLQSMDLENHLHPPPPKKNTNVIH